MGRTARFKYGICVMGKRRKHRRRADVHFHARPEGLGGLVVPGIHDTAANMFALRSGLLGACGFLDVDRKLSFGPDRIPESVS